MRATPIPTRCASRAHWWGRSGASVATMPMIEPPSGPGAGVQRVDLVPGRGHLVARDGGTDRHAVDPQQLARAVVGLDEHPDRPLDRRPRRDAVPMPPLNSWQIMPGAATDVALAPPARRVAAASARVHVLRRERGSR